MYMSQSIMLSNGGIGIYPLAVEESLGWYGVQSTTGLAFGWVSWLSQTMMVIIFGGLSLFISVSYTHLTLPTTGSV